MACFRAQSMRQRVLGREQGYACGPMRALSHVCTMHRCSDEQERHLPLVQNAHICMYYMTKAHKTYLS